MVTRTTIHGFNMKKITIIYTILSILILTSIVYGDISTGIISYWTFDTDNALEPDVFGLNNLTRHGTITWTNKGKIGGANRYYNNATGTPELRTDYFEVDDGTNNDDWSLTYNCWIATNWSTTEDFILTETYSDVADHQIGYDVYNNHLRGYVRHTTPDTFEGSINIKDGAWHMVTFVSRSDTDRQIYVDTVSDGTDSSANTFPNGLNRVSIGRMGDSSPLAGFNGLIDECGMWSKALNTTEIALLYNGGAGYNPFTSTNEAPVVNLTSPYNTDHLNDNPTVLTYNISDADGDLLNCSIYINDSLETTQTNINATTTPQKTYNFASTEHVYNWFVNCTDGTDVGTSETWEFIIDRTNPDWTITSINTDNTTIIDRETKDWIYFDDTLNDLYLFAYNITSYYPNGSIWFTTGEKNLTYQMFNYTNNQSITVSQPNGTYKITYYAEDDHTAKAINDYATYIEPNSLTFFTDTNQITINSVEGNTKDITTSKQQDRYTFSFEWNNARKEHQLELVCDDILYYRGDLYNYPTFICGFNWIDFVIKDYVLNDFEDIQVKQLSPYKYNINFKTFDNINKFEFQSLGGLNSVNESYLFEIKANAKPVIINTTPYQNFSVDDGEYINFTTIANDTDGDSISYYYYLNDVHIYTGQNLSNWFVPFNSHGVNNITVYASDGGGNNSFTWHINITHNPKTANVTYLDRTPLTTWYSNLDNTYIVCTGIDSDNETALSNLTAEIDYRTGVFWNNLTPINDGNGTFNALIDISTLEGETIDVRCRVSDGDYGFSDYYQVNNLVTIQQAYSFLGNVSSIKPSGVNRDLVTPVQCNIESFGSIKSYLIRYDIDAYYNNTWHNLSFNQFNKALFDMANIDYDDEVIFRCRATDGIETTEYLNSSPVTRKHITNLLMFDRGTDEVEKSHKQYFKGLYADFNNEVGVSIISSYADCNGDGFWDYYYEYDDGRNTTKETFTCYNREGIITHTVGVFINKTNSSNSLCGYGRTGVCNIERNYDVIVK